VKLGDSITLKEGRTMTDRYTTSGLISVEDARKVVLAHIDLAPVERVGILDSFGRILAQDISSDIDIKSFDDSAMDGFAVRYGDFSAAGEVSLARPFSLTVVGHIGAGSVFEGGVAPGCAVRIMTGAPLPEGTDTVVKIEDVQVEGTSAENPAGKTVRVPFVPEQGANVRLRGEEARAGDVLLHKGERIGIAGAGLLATTGNAEMLVYRRPRVAIIATGTELVDVTQMPGPGQIRNSNNYSIAAAAIAAGAEAHILPVVGDSYEALADALLSAVKDHDFVVTSGGAAEGDFDFITPVVRGHGELFFNKVNMKPGKAQTFGIIEGVPILGLPGNPSAAAVGFEILLRPAIRKTLGYTQLDRPVTRAILKEGIHKKQETRRLYLRARLERDDDGQYRVAPQPNQSSALLGALQLSNCLLIVREGLCPLAAGAIVECLRLDIEEGTI
jgi:molybdopterin molybdotransferase